MKGAKDGECGESAERTVIGWVCLLFVLACLLPCIDCGPGVPGTDPRFPDFTAGWHFGLLIVLFGWEGGNHGVPWSANVFLGIGLLCLWFRRYRMAGVLGLAASVLGLTTWVLNWFPRPHDYRVPVGCYCGQASQLILAIGAPWAGRAALPVPNVARPGEQAVEPIAVAAERAHRRRCASAVSGGTVTTEPTSAPRS